MSTGVTIYCNIISVIMLINFDLGWNWDRKIQRCILNRNGWTIKTSPRNLTWISLFTKHEVKAIPLYPGSCFLLQSDADISWRYVLVTHADYHPEHELICFEIINTMIITSISLAIEYGICEISDVTLGNDFDAVGNITSDGYPKYIPAKAWNSHYCRQSIVACPKCKIILRFVELQLPEDCQQPIPALSSCIHQ